MTPDEKPLLPSRGLMRKLLDVASRTGNTPAPGSKPRRSLGVFAPHNLLLGVLNEQLDADGTATATIWGYYPEDDEVRASGQTDYPVRDWLLEEGYHLPSGARIVIAVVGAAAFVIQSRDCPVEDE